MGGPLLTAAMIVRDEEHHLPDCLRSLRGVVDEVVVVDTGSVDSSVAIARAAGARVVCRPWREDFSYARNAGLELARGRWILYIDADERLRPVDPGWLRGLLADSAEVAYRILLRPFRHYTPYREYRLWRSDPSVRFDGVIHEKVVPAIHAVAAAHGRGVPTCDLELEHVGYDGDQSHKHARNLPLLRRQLAAEPGNVFNWWHLGTVLRATGETDEAEAAFRRAIEAAADGDPGRHGGQAFAELALLRLRRGEDVTDLLDRAQRRHPDNWRLVWIRAQAAMAAQRPAEALGWLDRLVRVDLAALPEQRVAYDERIFSAFAHESRGVCLFRLGRFAEAAEAFAAAESAEPDRIEHRVRRQLAQSRAAR